MVLLDTHVLIWALCDSSNLSEIAKMAIEQNTRCISIVSLWEIAIKSSPYRGEDKRLDLQMPLSEISGECYKRGISILPVSPEECEIVQHMPMIHGDPFDRMIIAQAMIRNIPLITKDERIWQYKNIKKIW